MSTGSVLWLGTGHVSQTLSTSSYRLSGLRKAGEHPAYTSVRSMTSFTFTIDSGEKAGSWLLLEKVPVYVL